MSKWFVENLMILIFFILTIMYLYLFYARKQKLSAILMLLLAISILAFIRSVVYRLKHAGIEFLNNNIFDVLISGTIFLIALNHYDKTVQFLRDNGFYVFLGTVGIIGILFQLPTSLWSWVEYVICFILLLSAVVVGYIHLSQQQYGKFLYLVIVENFICNLLLFYGAIRDYCGYEIYMFTKILVYCVQTLTGLTFIVVNVLLFIKVSKGDL